MKPSAALHIIFKKPLKIIVFKCFYSMHTFYNSLHNHKYDFGKLF